MAGEMGGEMGDRRFVAASGRGASWRVVCSAVLIAGALGACGLRTGPTGSVGADELSTFRDQGLAFTYPASWQLTSLNLPLHYEEILAYLGSGTGSFTCGTDYIPGAGGTCNESLSVPPGAVELKVSAWDGPPTPSGVTAFAYRTEGAEPMTIGGYPAAMRTIDGSNSSAERAVEWSLTMPGNDLGIYVLTAHFAGPDQGTAISQVDALLASIVLTTTAP
jgi:hypothetical protein